MSSSVRNALIDSHCHLDDPAFAQDRDEVFQRAKKAGVVALINPGSNIEESKGAIHMANTYKNVFAAVGAHPHAASPALDLDFISQALETLVVTPKVVAVGEFGLDVKHGAENLPLQMELVLRQLKIAKKHNLPIILHCRGLYTELLELLTKEGSVFRGVVHCFAGSTKDMQSLVDMGLYVAYGGLVTFGKKTEDLLEAVRNTPLDRMLLETDAPYLTPVPRRGKRNEPAEVATVAQFIADLRKIPYAELARVTTQNARNLFDLPHAEQENQ